MFSSSAKGSLDALWTWNLYGGWAGGETFFWSLPPAPGMENGVLGRNGRRRSSASCWCGSRALLLSLLPKRKWWRMSWRVSSKMNCAFSYSIFNLRLLPDVLLRPIHTTSRLPGVQYRYLNTCLSRRKEEDISDTVDDKLLSSNRNLIHGKTNKTNQTNTKNK